MGGESDRISWLLTFASSLTCILGSCVIYVDIIWSYLFPKHAFKFQDNPSVLVATLGISSGVLLFTALYLLLPTALDYLRGYTDEEKESDCIYPKLELIFSFLVGIVLSSLFNAAIHALTSKSIVHCEHEGHSHHEHGHDVEQALNEPNENSSSMANERTPLLKSKSNVVIETMQKLNLLDIADRSLRKKRSIGKCMGYTRVEDCACLTQDDVLSDTEATTVIPESISSSSSAHSTRVIDGQTDSNEVPNSTIIVASPQIDSIKDTSGTEDQHIPTADHLNIHYHGARYHGADDAPDGQTIEENHHHHVLTPYSHLFTIGLQTALAISVHKIPEGFLTFATTHHDTKVGINVFTALAVHNFSEGFSIAFPLFLAFKKRWLALLIAASLGGLSQPLGGLIAWTLFNKKLDQETTNKVFGWLVGGTSGFMTVIGFQMYGTSIYYGKQQSVTLWWAILGIAIIGISSSLE